MPTGLQVPETIKNLKSRGIFLRDFYYENRANCL